MAVDRWPHRDDSKFDTRDWPEYREPEPTKAELFAASFTGTKPPDCPCGAPAVGLDRDNQPICRLCSLLPELDFYEGPVYRTEQWQERREGGGR